MPKNDTWPGMVERVCETCKTQFRTYIHPHNLGKYCSRACYFGHPRPSLEERFWANVDKSGDCWLWVGPIASTGYGQLWTKDRAWGHVTTHRYSYELHVGPIAKGLEVCHRCDVRACVRPDHLFLGTQTENMADMVSKGRQSRHPSRKGEQSPHAKLSTPAVLAIRSAVANGQSLRSLAIQHGVTKENISAIAKRRTWKHV